MRVRGYRRALWNDIVGRALRTDALRQQCIIEKKRACSGLKRVSLNFGYQRFDVVDS